jgi:hypothetical protein
MVALDGSMVGFILPWRVAYTIPICRPRVLCLELLARHRPSSNDTWFAFLPIQQLDVRCDQLREAGAATRVTGTSFLVRICGISVTVSRRKKGGT